MDDKLKNLNLEDKKDINILLLGETGVGKSTFINSLVNYLHHSELEDAIEDPKHLIPCMINVIDDENEVHKIVIGTDSNELLEVGDSATQDVKTYVFPFGNGKTLLRFIDSPGMGDPRGVDQDDINCDNILSYIAQLDYLHAICFLFKPNEARITVTFEYCMKQILSRLDKSAAENIMFVFTNSKGTNYKPGETLVCLQKVVDNIKKQPPYVDIKLKDRIFCFDNESFRYLISAKQVPAFSPESIYEFERSWERSSREAWRFIEYIVGDSNNLPPAPHAVKNSISINEARKIILQLSHPLADISQLIFDNLSLLDRREKELKDENMSLDDLKEKLYVPVINLKVTELSQPATVCCDDKCRESYSIDGQPIWNYKRRCHDPCYLDNVPTEIVGAPQLQKCYAIDQNTQMCRFCECSYLIHMHIYYITEKFDDKKVDPNVRSRINNTEKALREAERVIIEVKKRKQELEHERETILKSAAYFSLFLQTNAITPFNDAYRKYIDYVIAREEARGRNADNRMIKHFKECLIRYDEIKSSFDKIKELSSQFKDNCPHVEVKDISSLLNDLYKLKHNGNKIKELFMSQNSSRKNEYQRTEYMHSSVVKRHNKPKTTTRRNRGGKAKQFNERPQIRPQFDDNFPNISPPYSSNNYAKPESHIPPDNDSAEEKKEKKDSSSDDNDSEIDVKSKSEAKKRCFVF